jgi:LmbE family N-acetylglucosaminyl deacetylase
MHILLRRSSVVVGLALIAVLAPRAQMRVVPLDDDQGHVALGLALRHLGNTGIFMHATAHPDDENNALLVMLNRGLGFRTTLVTATRGNGGQNEIGPEIFEALGVLRTEELAALHRFDGAEQYFTRAVDFGFSFSVDETFEKWGRGEITGDFVRLIRTIRPDVMLGLRPDGTGGGQHHEASAVISREAFKLAADPANYPEQITQLGLHPWQPQKYYFLGRFGGPNDGPASGSKLLSLNLAGYDPLLGRTYAEIGTEARSMHKCQGMAQLLSLPGPAPSTFELVESAMPGQAGAAAINRDERSLFDGIDYTIGGLARFAGPSVPRDLTVGLAALTTAVQSAEKAFETVSDAATVAPLTLGLHAVRRLRSELRQMPIDEAGRFEIDFRLRQKEREFQQAIVAANSIRIDALADDGVVVPGQAVKVSLIVANRGSDDVNVKQIKFDGFSEEATCSLTAVTAAVGGLQGRGRGGPPPAGPAVSLLKKGQVALCEPTLTLKGNERVSEPYWHRAGEAGRYTFDEDAPFGLPYRPSPFNVQITMTVGADAEEVSAGQTVQFRSEGDIFSGEKRAELLVVPPLSVRVSPQVAIVPVSSVAAAGGGAIAGPSGVSDGTREIRVTVVNDTRAKADTTVKLSLPSGWTSIPPEQAVGFAREDEAKTARFHVRPSSGAAIGEYKIGATASIGATGFSRGFQTIEYPHIRRQHIYATAETILKIIDVRMAPNLTVGYIVGVGDDVPAAIAQLGAKLEMIGPEELAWGNLSRFNTIVTGVRAYERRADLRANNSRLLDYVNDGGTLIVQYKKFEFNQAQYGPFPAKVTSARITDENAPVTLLNPGDPLLTTPNRISDATWQGWVQERGLYFLNPQDSHYHDQLQMVDPFPYNQGAKTGALVSAQYGKGHWVYVGLGLWRELPAGVPGAYQLLANLLSYKG